MPTLHLRIAPLHHPEHYAVLAQSLTALTASVLRKRPEVTVVVIDDLPAVRWTIGGQPTGQPTTMLQIDITAGTNTEADKAAFVREAFDVLTRHVGGGQGLATASYVIVREVPATDWGYGGHTQAARRSGLAEREAVRGVVALSSP